MAITPVPATNRKVHVYEVQNRTRMESLMVVTEADSTAILARLKGEIPPEAGFWTRHDDVGLEILAQHMTESTAEQFLKMHLERMQQRTWRFRVWRA